MKRTTNVLFGLALVVAAILIFIYVDHGFRPDTMDCGRGMNGVGMCYNEEGSFLVAIFKWLFVLALLLIGVAKMCPCSPAEELGCRAD